MKIEGLPSLEIAERIIVGLKLSKYIKDAKRSFNAKSESWTVYFYELDHIPTRGKAKLRYQQSIAGVAPKLEQLEVEDNYIELNKLQEDDDKLEWIPVDISGFDDCEVAIATKQEWTNQMREELG